MLIPILYLKGVSTGDLRRRLRPCSAAFDAFIAAYKLKYDKAAECLAKDRQALQLRDDLIRPAAEVDRQRPVDIGRAPSLAGDVAPVDCKSVAATPAFSGNTTSRGYCANACCAFSPVAAIRILARLDDLTRLRQRAFAAAAGYGGARRGPVGVKHFEGDRKV